MVVSGWQACALCVHALLCQVFFAFLGDCACSVKNGQRRVGHPLKHLCWFGSSKRTCVTFINICRTTFVDWLGKESCKVVSLQFELPQATCW